MEKKLSCSPLNKKKKRINLLLNHLSFLLFRKIITIVTNCGLLRSSILYIVTYVVDIKEVIKMIVSSTSSHEDD